MVVVGGAAEFTAFLNAVGDAGADHLPAPLVVLFEDESDMRAMKRQLSLDDGLPVRAALLGSRDRADLDALALRLIAALHFGALLKLVPHFVWESVVAGVDVARRVFDPRLPIRPGITAQAAE